MTAKKLTKLIANPPEKPSTPGSPGRKIMITAAAVITTQMLTV